MSEQAASDDRVTDPAQPFTIDVVRLQPMEIVIARRYVHEMPLDGFPGFDGLADQLDQQLADLPEIDLRFYVCCVRDIRREPVSD